MTSDRKDNDYYENISYLDKISMPRSVSKNNLKHKE